MIKICIGIATISIALFGQVPAGPTTISRDVKGLTPRTSPADYQGAAKAGMVTFAADFAGHGVPTADGVFETEFSGVVEIAVYGPAGAHLNLSYKDFSLRVNGKKAAIPAIPYEGTFNTLKDPEWVPAGEKLDTAFANGAGGGSVIPGGGGGGGRGGMSMGGGGQAGDAPPAPPKMPMKLRLAMEQKVAKAALPEGDRPLPEAGLIFFQLSGKTSNLKSIELIYNGAAGKAVIPLQ